nr:hypothetical protein Iba_chr12eCG6370 [Ipomoea batatas]
MNRYVLSAVLLMWSMTSQLRASSNLQQIIQRVALLDFEKFLLRGRLRCQRHKRHSRNLNLFTRFWGYMCG